MQFKGPLLSQGTELGYFLGLLNFQIFFGGVWNSWYIFFGWTVDAGSEPTHAEKIRVPPLGVGHFYGILTLFGIPE